MKFLHRIPALVAVAVFACLPFVPAAPASAFSMCRCSDPTFNALGTDVYKHGAFRIAVDWGGASTKSRVWPPSVQVPVADGLNGDQEERRWRTSG